MIYVMLAQQFLFRLRQRLKKKTPDLSLAEAKYLVATVLPRRSLDHAETLEILKYRYRRKKEAYLSHRNRRLAEAKQLGCQLTL
jgi:hypothetical protein